MLRWIMKWASHHMPSPERQAERALTELRMQLYRAEQHVLDAHTQADYYRSRIAFCEDVQKKGIEQVYDSRNDEVETAQEGRPSLKLTAKL